MNKNTLIAIITLVILILAGGAFMIMKRTQPVRESAVTPQSAMTTQNNTMMQKASLKTLMGMSNQKCNFTDVSSGSTGMMYVSNGKVRGDFSSKTNEKTVTSHMISDSENIYIWSDDSASGFKTSMKAMENIKQGAANNVQNFDMNRQVDYSCGGWSVDASVFAIPIDKKFEDMSAMMENAGKMMQNTKPDVTLTGTMMPGSAEACAACDQAPDAAKEQCRIALKCN